MLWNLVFYFVLKTFIIGSKLPNFTLSFVLYSKFNVIEHYILSLTIIPQKQIIFNFQFAITDRFWHIFKIGFARYLFKSYKMKSVFVVVLVVTISVSVVIRSSKAKGSRRQLIQQLIFQLENKLFAISSEWDRIEKVFEK
jgi:hypothetical protein